MRTYPVVERNESAYIWHDVEGREPFFDVPDIFASFEDGSSLADYYPRQTLHEPNRELHPQYVMENGVDVAHFKFVHKTPIVPVFTRHDFDQPTSYVDFTITFEGDENQSIDDIDSNIQAINGGLGIAVTKSSGMIDNRTISATTPVDDYTSDVRFTVYIGRVPGKDAPGTKQRRESSARTSSGSSSRTSTSGHTNAIRTRPHCPPPSSKGSPRSASGPKQYETEPSTGNIHNDLSRPTFCDNRTKCSTRSGNVAPMSSVDRTITEKLTEAVSRSDSPAVNSPMRWKSLSETAPKIPVSSSAMANSMTGASRLLLESAPPAKLPSPSPSIKPLTTIVTD